MAPRISNRKAKALGIERHIPAKSPGVHNLAVEGWTPPSVNRLWKQHWSVGHRLKKDAAARVFCAAVTGSVGAAYGKRRVGVTVTVAGRGGMPDPDNVLKVLLDALVANGLLVDDSARWCEIGEVAVVRGAAKRTDVVLQDIA